jgi:predicted ATP-dependent endonuclease of OLD family
MAKFMLDPTRNFGRDVANVVSVSFSAFDSLDPIRAKTDKSKGPSYRYVGLKKTSPREKDDSSLKDDAALSRDMTAAAKVCLEGARRQRWVRAIEILESDPMFAAAGLSTLVASADDTFFKELPRIFRRLSSGHKIVLLTITRLVETVVESTLVLMDEPETHLHPPLLSALVRSVSDLLINRNGLAIVATHSPVVLQEVPSTCVWRLDRVGFELSARRPALETFGENVGTLTNEVFGLEVTATGFHSMLTQAAYASSDYESALETFSGRVGAEGRAILRARSIESADV